MCFAHALQDSELKIPKLNCDQWSIIHQLSGDDGATEVVIRAAKPLLWKETLLDAGRYIPL